MEECPPVLNQALRPVFHVSELEKGLFLAGRSRLTGGGVIAGGSDPPVVLDAGVDEGPALEGLLPAEGDECSPDGLGVRPSAPVVGGEATTPEGPTTIEEPSVPLMVVVPDDGKVIVDPSMTVL